MVEPRRYELDADTRKHFLATANVPLHVLEFRWSRTLDDANVNRLESIFRASVKPDEPKHHIPAIVDPAELQEGWFKEQPNKAYELFQPPKGYKLQCLHGIHRAKAAERIFGKKGTWVVDFYDQGTSHAL